MLRIILILLIFSDAASGRAHAAELECGGAEEGTVQVDGLLDDWQGVTGLTRQGESAKDAAFTVRCNYDETTLYVSVDVQDERVIRRGKKDKGAEDRLALTIGKERLDVRPGSADGVAAKTTWNGKAVKGLEVADGLQTHGWAVEAAIPLARVRGWAKGVPALALAVEVSDADLLTEKKHQEVVSVSDAKLVFDAASAVYRQFLKDMKIKAADIRLDIMADMDGTPGAERVIVAGRIVGVLSDSYVYMRLPPAKAKDVLSVQIIDLAGDGKHAVVGHWVEAGNGGSREVIAVWNLLRDGSFPMIWGHEVAKVQGANKLTNTWSLEPRKHKKNKKKIVPGHDIIVRVGEAIGWTADTWTEDPAQDVKPILLPWAGQQIEHWHFRGDESYGGE